MSSSGGNAWPWNEASVVPGHLVSLSHAFWHDTFEMEKQSAYIHAYTVAIMIPQQDKDVSVK